MHTLPQNAREPRLNHLLAALDDAGWQRWRAQLEPVDLRLGQVLCPSGGTPTHAFFPTTAIVSLIYLARDGATAELAVVGNDGMVGIALLMGGNATPGETVVQSPGHAFRVPAALVKSELERGGAVLQLLLRYTQSMIAQMAQTAVCNRHHSIDQRLSRRLLLGLDRSPTDELVMTQELAASLLGVRRGGVTAAALKLQQAGTIRYSRGRIAILDRDRLEQQACECYQVVRKEVGRLMPMPTPLPMQMPGGAHAPMRGLPAFASSAPAGAARSALRDLRVGPMSHPEHLHLHATTAEAA